MCTSYTCTLCSVCTTFAVHIAINVVTTNAMCTAHGASSYNIIFLVPNHVAGCPFAFELSTACLPSYSNALLFQCSQLPAPHQIWACKWTNQLGRFKCASELMLGYPSTFASGVHNAIIPFVVVPPSCQLVASWHVTAEVTFLKFDKTYFGMNFFL